MEAGHSRVSSAGERSRSGGTLAPSACIFNSLTNAKFMLPSRKLHQENLALLGVRIPRESGFPIRSDVLSLVPAQIRVVVLGAAGIVSLAVQATPRAHQIVEHVGVEVGP